MTTTPGPWKVTTGHSGAGRVWATGDDICDHVRNVDDARLIAAAPDLYRELIAALVEHAAEQHIGADCECEACDRRRALLAKIEGTP